MKNIRNFQKCERANFYRRGKHYTNLKYSKVLFFSGNKNGYFTCSVDRNDIHWHHIL